jgi:hypothetical protein
MSREDPLDAHLTQNDDLAMLPAWFPRGGSSCLRGEQYRVGWSSGHVRYTRRIQVVFSPDPGRFTPQAQGSMRRRRRRNSTKTS